MSSRILVAPDDSSVPPTRPAEDAAGIDSAEDLAGRTADEMKLAWQQGRRLTVEDMLARRPDLERERDAVMRLVCEEICLRREHDLGLPTEDWLRRFPAWRTELTALLECHKLLEPEIDAAPEHWKGRLHDFQLLEELGEGGQGRVYLAVQPQLDDRPVVVKVTPCRGREHFTLARLQHTRIVPLYWAQDYPDENQRILCMPYFGRITLAKLLFQLRDAPWSERTGQHILGVLDGATSPDSSEKAPRGPARQLLARVNYSQAIVWMGACLADALHYAHERDLLHLDIKPSNVLWTSDGQPMLLDFHLARAPIPAHSSRPQNLGGTLGYMSPEQEAAMRAVSHGTPVPQAVDARADVFSLGLLLYEALGGPVPIGPTHPIRLEEVNAQVSPGLADVIRKCLARDPLDRYQEMESLANDLRRHLSDLPLRGVANRSLGERWRKWRRRKPHALRTFALAAATLAAVVALGWWQYGQRLERDHRLQQAEKSLAQAKSHVRDRQLDLALVALEAGRALVPADERALQAAFAEQQRLAERLRALQALHDGVDVLRSAVVDEESPPDQLTLLTAKCEALWRHRDLIFSGATPLDARACQDAIDFAVIWSELRLRRCPAGDVPAMRREIVDVLDTVDEQCGPSRLLDQHRGRQYRALGDEAAAARYTQRFDAAASLAPWEHVAIARLLLLEARAPAAHAASWAGQGAATNFGERASSACLLGESFRLAQAAWHCDQALAVEPDMFWAHFYRGVSAYRQGAFTDAAASFQVCIALQPRHAPSVHNRALAAARLDNVEQALADYAKALELDPSLGMAALHRAQLHLHLRNFAAAQSDLLLAQERGADPEMVRTHLAMLEKLRSAPQP